MTGQNPELSVGIKERVVEDGLPPLRELCWVGAVLAGLLLLFFLTPILRGEILSPADLLLKSDPWRQAAPPDFEPANALLSDYVYEMRPYRVITIASLKAGRIPLWDPHNYAGAPFLGNGISGALYPLNLLVLFLPEATSILLSAMIRLFIAGLAAYVFSRVIGLSILGAGIASLGFAFLGFLVVWLLYPHADVAIWLPALFLAAEAIIRRPTIFRTIALAVIVCIQFLGGHPETSLHILSAVALYVCWRAGMLFREESDWRRLAHRLAAFSGALILGTAGAAVQLVPLGEYILASAMLRERIALAPPFWFLPRPRLLAMVALACPYCFGSHLRGDLPLGVLLGVGNFNELNGGYVGLISLALVGIAIALGARRGLDLFFLLLGGLTLCVAYAIPPVFNLIHALPLFRVSANTRLLLLLAFALSVLAGRGADLLMAAPEERLRRMVKRTWKILIAGMAGVAIVSGGCLVTVLSFREKILGEAKAPDRREGWKGDLPAGPRPLPGLTSALLRPSGATVGTGGGREGAASWPDGRCDQPRRQAIRGPAIIGLDTSRGANSRPVQFWAELQSLHPERIGVPVSRRHQLLERAARSLQGLSAEWRASPKHECVIRPLRSPGIQSVRDRSVPSLRGRYGGLPAAHSTLSDALLLQL